MAHSTQKNFFVHHRKNFPSGLQKYIFLEILYNQFQVRMKKFVQNFSLEEQKLLFFHFEEQIIFLFHIFPEQKYLFSEVDYQKSKYFCYYKTHLPHL